MPTHPHILDLLPAYALGILDPDEISAVEKHLAECTLCQMELRAYEAVTADLALASPLVSPPPQLEQQILDAVTPPTPAPEPWWRRWLDALRRPGYSLAAASAALALVLLISNLVLITRVNTLENQLAALSQAGLGAVSLSGSEIAPQARAILVMDKDAPVGLLVADDLPPLDESHAYQLWLISPDGRRESGGVFRVDDRGHGSLEIQSPGPLQQYAAFGVTIEPAGGSPAPTGPNVLKGRNQPG